MTLTIEHIDNYLSVKKREEEDRRNWSETPIDHFIMQALTVFAKTQNFLDLEATLLKKRYIIRDLKAQFHLAIDYKAFEIGKVLLRCLTSEKINSNNEEIGELLNDVISARLYEMVDLIFENMGKRIEHIVNWSKPGAMLCFWGAGFKLKGGDTALHLAAQRADDVDPNILWRLVDAGWNIYLKNEAGETAEDILSVKKPILMRWHKMMSPHFRESGSIAKSLNEATGIGVNSNPRLV